MYMMSLLLGVLIVAATRAVQAVSKNEPPTTLLVAPIYRRIVVRMGQQMPWMGSAIIMLDIMLFKHTLIFAKFVFMGKSRRIKKCFRRRNLRLWCSLDYICFNLRNFNM